MPHAQAPPLGPEQRGLRVRAQRPLFLCRRREGVGHPEGGGTAPPRSSWTFTPSLGGPSGGGPAVFPQKLCHPGREPGPAVKGAAKLEKLEPSLQVGEKPWRQGGLGPAGGQVPLQAGAPCWRPPDCAQSLWPGGHQHRTPGATNSSQRRAPLPWESAPPQGGCDKGTGRCCKARHSGPAGTPARRVSAAARAPGESS